MKNISLSKLQYMSKKIVLETSMPQFHKVEQGEHLSRIALQYGFNDYKTIYDHPQNAQLKKKRPNPNVLFPGDRLYIPDKQDQQQSRSTGNTHNFQTPTSRLKLRIVIGMIWGQPVSSAQCRIQIDGSTQQITTDPKGMIDQTIQAKSEKGEICIMPNDRLLEGICFTANIGHLDPVEELSGQGARLLNLGYYLAGTDDNPEEFRSAVEEFQCDNKLLPVDGICGPSTQAKLKEVYGS